MILKGLWIAGLMWIIPLILGFPWIKILKPRHQYAFSYCSGFFIELALFQLVSVPIILLYGNFKTIVFLFSFVLVLACSLSVIYTIRKKILNRIRIGTLRWTEWIYLVAFVLFLAIQVSRGITNDITYMSYDDSAYTVIAADAFADNGVVNINYYTGVAKVVDARYSLASWNVYPAYFAFLSGLSVPTITHTVQYIQLIILAYTVCWYMAGEIITKRDNQMIFMVVIALFYWFGYHSHYSLTFRLLGPNYQGKAVLAVSLTPLILTVLIKKMDEDYMIGVGAFLLFLSIAGLSLTLWATGTIFVIVLIPLILSLFRRSRRWRHLLYAPWTCFVPSLAVVFYLLTQYAV